MTKRNHEDLERAFDENGVPRRWLYPWWYRLYRAIGVDLAPPVLLGLRGHILYVGLFVLLTFVVLGTLSWALWGTSPWAVAITGAICAALTPFASWLRFRRIQRRAGLRCTNRNQT